MIAFTEYRHYSALHDAEMSRVSMTDGRGAEYFMLIPAGDGKESREARTAAVEALEQAIAMKLEPGEVRTR